MLVDQETKKEALQLAHNAAKVLDIELDFSNSSIEKVEKILSNLSKKYHFDSNEKEAKQFAFAFAAYIVEVVEKNFSDKKGEWRNDDEAEGPKTYPYLFPDGSKMFPFAWCMKRIVDGQGDDVWFKYNTLILNKFHED